VGEIVEEYVLTQEGLGYSVRLSPEPEETYILVPIIQTDGQEASSVTESPSRLDMAYRGGVYGIRLRSGQHGAFTDDEPAANRNAVYRTWRVHDTWIKVELGR
jgi:hypothetical protein